MLAGVEAYNNFLFEEFCAPDPTRLDRPGADPVARHRLRRSTGCARPRRAAPRASSSRTGRPVATSVSDADDPFWAAAVDEGMPVTVHINIISRDAALRQAQAPRRRRRATRSTAASERGREGEGGRRPQPRVLDVAGNISQMIFTGVFDRFPELHIVVDRDRRRLAAALHRDARRQVLAQPLVGRAPDRASRRRSTGGATTQRHVHHRPVRHRPARSASASTTSCGRATTRTTATTGRTRARSSRTRWATSPPTSAARSRRRTRCAHLAPRRLERQSPVRRRSRPDVAVSIAPSVRRCSVRWWA